MREERDVLLLYTLFIFFNLVPESYVKIFLNYLFKNILTYAIRFCIFTISGLQTWFEHSYSQRNTRNMIRSRSFVHLDKIKPVPENKPNFSSSKKQRSCPVGPHEKNIIQEKSSTIFPNSFNSDFQAADP